MISVSIKTLWVTLGTGGSSGDAVIEQINDPTHPYGPGDVGKAVRMDTDVAYHYILAIGDSEVNAEVVGLIIAVVPGVSFTIQQAGRCTTFTGLAIGRVYFLDDINPGVLTLIPPVANGHVKRACLIAESTTTGWILPYPGLVIGNFPPIDDSNNAIIRHIVQTNHMLNLGDWVRLENSSPTVGLYVRALADSVANDAVIGLVIEVIDADNFILQFCG